MTEQRNRKRTESLTDDESLGRRTVNAASVKQMLEDDREVCLKHLSETIARDMKALNNELLSKLTTVIDERLQKYTDKISELENIVDKNLHEISTLQSVVSEMKIKNDEQSSDIDILKQEISLIKVQNLNITSLSDISVANVKKLEDRIEERTNRQLRKTIVIKGIQELDGGESWMDTRELVAETLSTHIKCLSYDEALDMFERVHRGPPTKNIAKKNARDIYAALHDWDDCEFLTKTFRKINAKNKNLKIYIDYKYGPLTTRRRSEALKVRKELLSDRTIVAGYIAYPAKLYVKSAGDDNYSFLKDFSDSEVPGLSLNFEII